MIIIQELDKELHHFFILTSIFPLSLFHHDTICNIWLLWLLWDQPFVPSNEEHISIKIWSAYLRSKWNCSTFGKYDSIRKVFEIVFSFAFIESLPYLFSTYALDNSNIRRMAAGISSNHYSAWNVLAYLLRLFYGTIYFIFF